MLWLLLFLNTLSFAVAEPVIEADSARLRVAGPDSVLLDGVQINGRPYLVRLVFDEGGMWRVAEVLSRDANGPISENIVLDLARLSVDDTGRLIVDNVFLDGAFYSGTIEFDDRLERVESYRFIPSEPVDLERNELVELLLETYASSPGESAVQPRVEEREEATESTEAPEITEPPPSPHGGMIALSGEDMAAHYADLIVRLDRIAALIEENAITHDERLMTVEARIDELTERLMTVDERIRTERAAMDRRVADLMNAVAATPSSAPTLVPSAAPDVRDYAPTMALSLARATMSSLTTVDLDGGNAVGGVWNIDGSTRIVQADPEAYFAKFTLSYSQDSRPRLYRLIMCSLDPGWAGVGLHLSVTGVLQPTGYGHGRSVLIWLTRDEATYGTDATFLEVYVSHDDVNMNRVAQARIDTDLSDPNAVETLFDPGANMLTVAVDGTEYLRYRMDLARGSSVELALRSLGRGEFRDLEVRTLP
ncbi:MAG: hypothetical protein MI724_07530 [Spirochaetales bacterium]|nr:hypothetical protein [Spirochaetales bacterium]